MKMLNRVLHKLKDMSIQREIHDITVCIDECRMNMTDLRERAQRLSVTESMLRMRRAEKMQERENNLKLLDAYEQVSATETCMEFPR